MKLTDRLCKLEALTGQNQILRLINWSNGQILAAICGHETLAKADGESDAAFMERASKHFEVAP